MTHPNPNARGKQVQTKLQKVVTAPPSNRHLSERILEFEIEITGVLCCVVLAGYWAGSPLAKKCLFISYQMGPDAYSKGVDDAYFVGFWIVAFTFLRAAVMKYLFHPLAKTLGIEPFGKRQRFAEQGFMFAYYAIYWNLGMYIMYQCPHWFDTSQFWIDYPHIIMKCSMKYYYLTQMAFWFQQLYCIQTEKRRKDHYAMFSHHIITITLLVSSYYTNFTRIGNAVLCSMDLTDLLLSLAKILKYIGLSTLCDITFALFAIAWPITRHGFFTIIIWATAVEPSKYLDMQWEPELGKYFTPLTQKMYLVLFLLLDVIMIYWFSMIVRVVIRVIQGKGAEDTRSDDEDDEEEIQTVDKKKLNGKQE